MEEFQGKLNQPIVCLAAGVSPPQASLASLRLAALLVGIRQEEAMRSREIKLEMEEVEEEEVRNTMLVASVPLPLGLYEATVNKFNGRKASGLLVSC